jgi:hypothetical protein
VIRRLFWLTLGAIAGVAGYRRVEKLAQRRSLVSAVRGTARFARDVRAGMDEYSVRQQRSRSATLTTPTDDERHGNGVG